uniref:Sema domain-containing protein n=1 Tax=Syphacia muris TaxID=451379 RepID=A0A0N5AQC5_9BILA
MLCGLSMHLSIYYQAVHFPSRNQHHLKNVQKLEISRLTTMFAVILLLLTGLPVAKTGGGSSENSDFIVAQFKKPFDMNYSMPLEKMVIDPSTGRLYVGGVNNLFDLQPSDLAIKNRAILGPIADEKSCYGPSCSATATEWKDYHVKGLAVCENHSKLIDCTNVNGGQCRWRNLYDINATENVVASWYPLLSNNVSASVVIFVGTSPTEIVALSLEQPFLILLLGPALYVGSTITEKEATDIKPSVLSVSLSPESERLFDFVSKKVNGQTSITLSDKFRGSYKIEYINGFQSGKFAYFVTRQPVVNDEMISSTQIISKLVRICTNDTRFYSYTEVPLECYKGDILYNLVQDVYVTKAGFKLGQSLGISEDDPVLYGVFTAKSSGHTYNGRSALCVFSMKYIEERFINNTMTCHGGIGRKNLPYFQQNAACSKTEYLPEEVECGNDANNFIGGKIPIRSEASLAWSNTTFTAIVVDRTGIYTVAFIGTSEGTLLKVVLESSSKSFVYRTLDIARGTPILQDLEIDENGDYLFALTRNAVYKIKIRQCDRVDNCQSCTALKDPYCGWCLFNSDCKPENECIKPVPVNTDYWISVTEELCPQISLVQPSMAPVSKASLLRIEFKRLPEIASDLYCVFEFGKELRAKAVATNAVVERRTSDSDRRILNCDTPGFTLLPVMDNRTSILSKLSIRNGTEGANLADAQFTLFDCARFSSCTACVSSPFPCDWCLDSNKCVDGSATENSCRSETIINGRVRGISNRQGPRFCPSIDAVDNSLYVPSGSSKRINVTVSNLMDIMKDFKCRFIIQHTDRETFAVRDGNVISCDAENFSFLGRGSGNGTEEVLFFIQWSAAGRNGGYVIDNPNRNRITVYKCEELAKNCGLCLALDEKFGCSWCTKQNKCTLSENCMGSGSLWLKRTQLCPEPVITDFYPRKGPTTGGTRVTITGINLGQTASDVKNKVMIANVKCIVQEKLYVPSSVIVCLTNRSPTGVTFNRVIVSLKDNSNYTAVSTENFSYVAPSIRNITPAEGPLFGGNILQITGNNLDAGYSAEVILGNVSCTVLKRSNDHLVCRMGRSHYVADVSLTVLFDSYKVQNEDIVYSFRRNPTISGTAFIKSIESGGILTDVSGTDFHLVQRPYMVVYDEDKIFKSSECTILGDNLIQCLTPAVTISDKLSANSKPFPLSYGIELDGNIRNVSDRYKFYVYPDPYVEKFKGIRYYRPNDYLTINGDDLDKVALERDIRVTVGGELCIIRAIATRALTCTPPAKRPKFVTRNADPEVVVQIGNSSTYVGKFSYNQKNHDFSPQAVIVIVVIIVLIVLAFFVLVISYRRKSTSHMREMKHLRNQIDQIEMKVATECKDAFAELQTSMNAITAELPRGTPFIPFLPYKDYIARVLFSNNYQNHPVLKELEVKTEKAKSIEMGLLTFNKLLMNKHFLLTSLRAMEENKYFLSKDRVVVGSLLMVILLEKMEYCTDVLKQLLKELIVRTVEKKFQPKILFRRSESVAERMLSVWYAFLMHDYLTDYAGQKLYELYWAIKQQMEKGPQDEITLESRYSLSEEKLLRATVEFRELTIHVILDNHNPNSMDMPVRVLDCDTITQVKEKCLDVKYRTVPFSERPLADDLDLELRSSQRLILQDIDSTSRTESGGWKKINTLAHYKVPNDAVFVLLPRQTSLYNLSLLSERSERSTFSLTKQSPTLSRPFGTNSSTQSKGLLSGSDSNFKQYHLVKPSEQGHSDRQDKMVTEIYLTRLLTMKGTLQKFIQDLLYAIFSTGVHGSSKEPPICVRYMFDFLDEQAREHGIDDEKVVHAWKSNSLPLRFWVNLIKNPHFAFDIQKPTKVEGCLSVVAQTLMDACSTQEHQLTKDSPSSKLLFAKDIYQYREWVDSYYKRIRSLPTVSDQEMSAFLAEQSRNNMRNKFYVFSALYELYEQFDQNKELILEALERSPIALSQRLPGTFREMLLYMDSTDDQLLTETQIYKGFPNIYQQRPREDLV